MVIDVEIKSLEEINVTQIIDVYNCELICKTWLSLFPLT